MHRDDFENDITNLKTFHLWEKVRDELFAEGEKRDESDPPPRDMPASVYLKMRGWRSDSPVKRTFSWFDIDFEYGGDETVTSLNNMGFPEKISLSLTREDTGPSSVAFICGLGRRFC